MNHIFSIALSWTVCLNIKLLFFKGHKGAQKLHNDLTDVDLIIASRSSNMLFILSVIYRFSFYEKSKNVTAVAGEEMSVSRP